MVPSDDLNAAARLLAERQTDAVIVVRDRPSSQVHGLFTRRDLIVACGRCMARLRGEATDVSADHPRS